MYVWHYRQLGGSLSASANGNCQQPARRHHATHRSESVCRDHATIHSLANDGHCQQWWTVLMSNVTAPPGPATHPCVSCQSGPVPSVGRQKSIYNHGPDDPGGVCVCPRGGYIGGSDWWARLVMTNASHTSVDVPFLRSVCIPTHSMDGQTDGRTAILFITSIHLKVIAYRRRPERPDSGGVVAGRRKSMPLGEHVRARCMMGLCECDVISMHRQDHPCGRHCSADQWRQNDANHAAGSVSIASATVSFHVHSWTMNALTIGQQCKHTDFWLTLDDTELV